MTISVMLGKLSEGMVVSAAHICGDAFYFRFLWDFWFLWKNGEESVDPHDF